MVPVISCLPKRNFREANFRTSKGAFTRNISFCFVFKNKNRNILFCFVFKGESNIRARGLRLACWLFQETEFPFLHCLCRAFENEGAGKVSSTLQAFALQVRNEPPDTRDQPPGARDEPQARDELRGVRDELPDTRDQPPGARDEPPGGALEASRCLQETPRRLLGSAAVSLGDTLETPRGVQAPNLQKHYTFNRSSLSDMGPL